ncbi:hypothetical protein AK812_SmicGene4979 [Symbiodinium microadriaticum]|uniref:Uncharacterized protein n=1 Tax=Symbiodinium microadriaticum TaxID=2951 RepID=A0A1Q9EUX2_SYMMI|nr:hypothetical protein AK812_SmicGene4979 [Symbiodinium microadriaticum]
MWFCVRPKPKWRLRFRLSGKRAWSIFKLKKSRLEALLRREKEAEALQRKEAARTQRLDEEVRYWKNCGLILRRKQAGEMLKRSRNDSCEEELFNYVEQAGPQVAMEIEALRAQAKELRIQIKEMERLAASGRAQEVDLIAKNQSMAHSVSTSKGCHALAKSGISMAEAAAKASREKATSLRAELQEAWIFRRPEEVEEGLGVEEVEYWRRKVDEKKAEVERATADQQRLRGTLRESAPSLDLDVGEALATRCGIDISDRTMCKAEVAFCYRGIVGVEVIIAKEMSLF